METVETALQLLKRQAELETAMRRPGGVRITEERELMTLKSKLEKFPEAAAAVVQASHALRRPVAKITARDVEAWANA